MKGQGFFRGQRSRGKDGKGEILSKFEAWDKGCEGKGKKEVEKGIKDMGGWGKRGI